MTPKSSESPTPDLSAVLQDVQTIKSLLSAEDAPLPRFWIIAWTLAVAVTAGVVLQLWVPFFHDQNFDGRMFWLWIPGFCVMFPAMMVVLGRELKRTGRKFMGQGRIRHILYVRFLIPPALLTLLWTASRNGAVSLEGTFLVLVSLWQATIEQALPPAFRTIPFLFLGLGLLEIVFDARGDAVTLFNGLVTALTLALVGALFYRHAHRAAGR